MVRSWLGGPKDLIAFMLIGSYSLAFLITVCVPEVVFNEVLGRQFERIILMVVGFYFGSHREKRPTNAERIEEGSTCTDCSKSKSNNLLYEEDN
jgi:hypothetical protein